MSAIAEAFVRVRPDASGFGSELDRQTTPGLRRFENQLRGSNRELGRFGRGALVGTGALQGLGRAAAFASASFIGGAGLVYGIKSTISAAMEAQVVLGQTEQAVKNAGLQWDTYSKQIQDAATATSRLAGFDDERLLRTFSTLVRRTGDVNKAIQLNALAADVARGRNIELEQAVQLVLRASLGQAGALRRLGIDAKVGATRLELIQLLSEKYAGSAAKFADTAAGAQARFNVAVQNTQETIGTALLPTLTTYLNKASEWLEDTDNQERIQRDVNEAVKDGTAILKAFAAALRTVKDITEPLVDAVGGLRNAVELLIGFSIARRLTGLATGFTAIGREATLAKGTAGGAGVLGLGSALRGLPTQIAITLAIQQTLSEGKGGGPIHEAAQARAQQWAAELGTLLNQSVNPLINPAASGPVPSVNPAFNPAAAGPVQTAATITLARAQAAKSTRDQQTLTDLARAQAEGNKAQITAAAKARLDFIRDTIAFANKLVAEGRGDTKQLQATLQKFYADEASTQGILDDFARQAAQDAQDRADKRQKLIEDTRAAAKEVSDNYLAILAQEAQDAKEHRQLVADIQLQILENNLAQAQLIPNTKKELAAEKTAQKLIVDWYKQRARNLGLNTLAGQQAQGQYLQALQAFRNLGKKDKQASGFTLAELFAEADSEFALYGSNVGPGPLSAQDARGQFAGTVKTHQTTVVQNFYGERSAGQALADAAQVAKNMKD